MNRYPGNDLDLGQIVGCKNSAGIDASLILSRRDRARHTYMVGATRTGKTKMMEGMVRQDILNWPKDRCPVFVLDPHGTLYDSLMEYAAGENLTRRPVVPVDLRRGDMVVSYNLLRRREGLDAAVAARSFAQAILHAWGQSNSNMTPRLISWLETLLMLAYERECSLVEALELIRNAELRDAITGEVRHLVARAMLESAGQLREAEFQDRVESTLYRINRFLSTQLMRATLCQGGATLDMTEALEEGSIVLVNTSTKGTQLTQEDATTFGSLLLTDLWQAAGRRGKQEEGKLRPAYLFIDEFQNFVTPAIAKGLAEASGMGLHMTLAHQFPSQLSDVGEMGQAVLNAVMANAKNKIVFQLGHPEDLEMMAVTLFRPHVNPDKVKQEIHSTKVLDHQVQYLPSYSTSTSRQRTNGTNWGNSVTDSRTNGTQRSHTDGVSDTVTVSESDSDGTSDSVSRSEGTSISTGIAFGENESTGSGSNRGRGNSANLGNSQGTGLSRAQAVDGSPIGDIVQQSSNNSLSNSRGQNDSEGTSLSRGRGASRSLSSQRGRSRSRSLTHGESHAHTVGVSEAHSVSSSDTYGESESTGRSVGVTRGGSQAQSVGTSDGQSSSPMLNPILGTELSSRQFVSIDEQLFRYAQLIDGLPDRHCIVRLASQQRAIPLFTHTIRKSLATTRWTADWTTRALRKLPFVVSMTEAMDKLAVRERKFVADILNGGAADQPTTARRPYRRVASRAT